MKQRGPFTPRWKAELPTVVIAILLLCAMGAWWLSLSRHATREREEILARIPAFPKRGDPPRERPHPTHQPVVASVAPAKPEPRKSSAPKLDAARRFILNAKPGATVQLIHLNALLNAPFIRKLDKCFPPEELAAPADGGIDFTRDVDTIASVGDATIATGFFGDNPDVSQFGCRDAAPSQSTYRGFRIVHCDGKDLAVESSMIVDATGPDSNIQGLVDQALDAPSNGDGADDIYGDIFMRTNPSGFAPPANPSSTGALINAALSKAQTATMRANVWDSVALTVDAVPEQGTSAGDLAAAANAALATARSVVDDEDIPLSTYAELAKVAAQNDQMHVDLALPTDELVTQLNGICQRDQERAARRAAEAKAELDAGQEPAEP
jgi:hypothetical protein